MSQVPPVLVRSAARHRIARLIALGALACVVAWSYRFFWLILPMGQGPAGPDLSPAEFATPLTQRPVFLLGLGDGLTEGTGLPRHQGHFFLMTQSLMEGHPTSEGVSLRTLFPRLQPYNRAIEGSSSLEHLEQQIDRLPERSTECLGIVVFSTGACDLFRDDGLRSPREGAVLGARAAAAAGWVEAFEHRLDRMMDGIRARFPGGCQIFLANIPDATDGEGDVENIGLPRWEDATAVLHLFNRAIARCAERHTDVHLVDLHGAFLGHGVHCTKFWRATYREEDPHCWFQEDLELPNARGADAIRRLFLLEIRRALGDS